MFLMVMALYVQPWKCFFHMTKNSIVRRDIRGLGNKVVSCQGKGCCFGTMVYCVTTIYHSVYYRYGVFGDTIGIWLHNAAAPGIATIFCMLQYRPLTVLSHLYIIKGP